jgi:hypothetical protein
MKFKLLKPRRRRRRPKNKPLTPDAHATAVQRVATASRKASRQITRRQTIMRLACAAEITRRRVS